MLVFSTNCLRELDHAVQQELLLVPVHETDENHGGASLDKLRCDCISQGRDAEFMSGNGIEIITWHRVYVFQLLSIKLIAENMLQTMPTPQQQSVCGSWCLPLKTEQPKLYVTGGLLVLTMEFRKPVLVYVSSSNPGAIAVETALADRYKDNNLKFEHRATAMSGIKPPKQTLAAVGKRAARRFSTSVPKVSYLPGAHSTLEIGSLGPLPTHSAQWMDLNHRPLLPPHPCQSYTMRN